MKTHQREPPSLSVFFLTIRPRFLILFVSLLAGLIAGLIASSYVNTCNLPIQLPYFTAGGSNSPIQLSYFTADAPPMVAPPTTNSTAALVSPEDQIETKRVMHSMTDEELLRRASMVPLAVGEPSFRGVPKVAFLFLARGRLPFAPLWEKFFAGHEGRFSIYVHVDPSYEEPVPPTSVFSGRRVPSQAVKWGKISMAEAERRLLANALLDFSNERFVLLSEACIPLYSFPEIYSYLINSSTTFIESYDEPGPTGRGRYSRRMAPTVQLRQWRKGSQWFELDRFLARQIVADRKFFPVFAKFCKSSCYADEHYLPTVVGIRWPRRNANRSLTWVDWSGGGAHPARFWRPAVTEELLRWMRSNSTCTYNGRNTTVCFLFARKFLPSSLTRLLRYAPTTLGFG